MTEQPQTRSWAVPPVFLLVALIVEFLISRIPGAEFVTSPWNRIGYVLIAVGLALAAWAASIFTKRGTPVLPYEEATALVTNGPYRVTRNPMYLGMVLVLLGEAFLLQKLLPFVLPFIFAGVIRRRFIVHEEARLQAKFGAEAEQYFERVKRWL